MEVSGIATTVVSQTAQNSATGTAVHKKALEIQEQNASQLIESIPEPSSPVGQHVDIKV